MKKRLKIVLAFDSPYPRPRGYDFREEFRDPDWITERDVYKALRKNGHDVSLLGIYDDMTTLIEEVKEEKPDIVFNLMEVFNDKSHLDKNVAWLLEMLETPYTGASPSDLLICNDKALSKKILSFHGIKVPNFHTFYRNRKKVRLPKDLKTPLIVKPLMEEASRGLAQGSIVTGEKGLIERVKFIHKKMQADAIVEEYIAGRELYVGVLGPGKIKVFPPIEMKFGRASKGESRIATYRAKWDDKYRKRWKIRNSFIGRLPAGVKRRIDDICKDAYRALNLQSYVRFDIRITSSGDIYILEANANPCLAKYEDFSQAAEKSGIPYKKLIQRITSTSFCEDT